MRLLPRCTRSRLAHRDAMDDGPNRRSGENNGHPVTDRNQSILTPQQSSATPSLRRCTHEHWG